MVVAKEQLVLKTHRMASGIYSVRSGNVEYGKMIRLSKLEWACKTRNETYSYINTPKRMKALERLKTMILQEEKELLLK